MNQNDERLAMFARAYPYATNPMPGLNFFGYNKLEDTDAKMIEHLSLSHAVTQV